MAEKHLAARLRISTDFRRTHYDDSGSVFMPEGDVQELLGELLRDVITGAEYWSRARRHQRWQHRPAEGVRTCHHSMAISYLAPDAMATTDPISIWVGGSEALVIDRLRGRQGIGLSNARLGKEL